MSRTEATQPGRAVADEAMRAFLAALEDVEATAPTWCRGWSAHEVASHVAAAAQERANLIEERLAGQPGRSTRSWEEREPLSRAMPDQDHRWDLFGDDPTSRRLLSQPTLTARA